jgi:hypothetical protein
VYADGHYGGTRVCLAAGRYDLRALAQSGVKNDSVSSVQVPSSYSALPYEHDAFSGRELVVVSDTPKLPANTFDNRLSSSVVVKVGVVDPSTRRPLRAVGNKVVDGTGRTVRLRGVNIAGLEWSRTGEQMDRSIDEAVKVWKANVVGATTRLGCAELGDSFEECRCV